MTNLLEKIAAVVARELVRQAQNCGEYQNRNCYEVAEAVIRELGLHTQTVAEAEKAFWGLSLIHRDTTDYRYVTDWKAA